MPRSGPANTTSDASAAPSGKTLTAKGARGLRRPRQKASFGSAGGPGGWDPADTSGGSYGSQGFGASGHGSRGDVPGSVQGGPSPDTPPKTSHKEHT